MDTFSIRPAGQAAVASGPSPWAVLGVVAVGLAGLYYLETRGGSGEADDWAVKNGDRVKIRVSYRDEDAPGGHASERFPHPLVVRRGSFYLANGTSWKDAAEDIRRAKEARGVSDLAEPSITDVKVVRTRRRKRAKY